MAYGVIVLGCVAQDLYIGTLRVRVQRFFFFRVYGVNFRVYSLLFGVNKGCTNFHSQILVYGVNIGAGVGCMACKV